MSANPMRLYAHPFSSYCQKVLVALYENATPFDYRNLEDAQNGAELAAAKRSRFHNLCFTARNQVDRPQGIGVA